MPVLSLDDIADIEPTVDVRPPRLSVSDIAEIEPAPSLGGTPGVAERTAPQRLSVNDIASIESPEPSALEQQTIATAPGKVRPSIGDLFKLKPGPVPQPAPPPPYTGDPQDLAPQSFGESLAGRALVTTVEGVRQLGKGISDMPSPGLALTEMGTTDAPQPFGDEVGLRATNAASDLIEGLFKAATPAVIAAGAVAPAATVLGLAKTMIAGKVGQKGAELAGASPELQRLASNVAAVAGGVVGAHGVMDSIRQDARVVIEQLRADPTAGVGLNIGGVDLIKPRPGREVSGVSEVSPEPVNVGRGATPAAGGRLVEEQAQSTRTNIHDVSEIAAIEPPKEALSVLSPIGATEQIVPRDTIEPPTTAEAPASVTPLLPIAPTPANGQATAAPAPERLSVADIASIEPTEQIAQPVADRLDTGEQQVRLPSDVGQVRDQQTTTPAIAEAPFSLEAEPATRTGVTPALDFGGPAQADAVTVKASDGRPTQPEAASTTLDDGDAGTRVQPPAPGPLGGERRARDARPSRTSTTRQQEADVIDGLVTRARDAGFTGDHQTLTAALRERANALREIHKDTHDAGGSPGALLEAIVKAGGISRTAESALKGEIDWLKQSPLAKRKGLFHESAGLTLDGVVEALREDTRFPHIDDINDLVDALTEIASSSVRDTTAITAKALGAVGERWWDRVLPEAPAAPAPPVRQSVDEIDSIEPAGEGDASFDPAELEKEPPLAERATKGYQPFTSEQRAIHASSFRQTQGQRDALGEHFWTHPAVPDRGFPTRKAAENAARAALKASRTQPDFERPAPVKPSVVPPRKSGGGGGGAQSRPLGTRRADATGALTEPPGRHVLSLLKPGERQLRPSEIVTKLAQNLDDLPIRVGKFKQRALGIYKPKEQTIRLKVANDLDTLAHELGHHIHETVMGDENPAVLYRGELEALGLPTSRPSYTLKQKLAEGQAEFTRYYLTDPTKAEQLAPIYFKAFEAGLRAFPELARVLQETQRQYTGHLSQDPVTRGISHIDFAGVQDAPKGDVVTRMQTAWVDDLYPLRRMVEQLADHEPVDVTRSGYALARLARGAPAKADGFLRFGVRDTDGTFMAGALEPALKPVRGRLRDFAAYLVASRVPELRARNMETGMSAVEASAIRAKFQSPVFDAARQAVYDYQDGLLQYAQRSGVLSAKQLAQMKALNKSYVPFQRVITDIGAAAGGGSGKVANRANPTKRIKGSGRDIINPLESIVRNTHTLVTTVEQNRAMLALVDQANRTAGGGRFLERVPEKQVATAFNLSQLEGTIREHLEDAGVDVPDNLDLDELVTVFTPQQFPRGERGIVTVLRDGKREWYEVNDAALFDAITSIGPQASSFLLDMVTAPTRYLRAGATTTLGFIVRNPIRDTFEAFVNSRYGFRLGYDSARGLFHFLKKDEAYQRFLNSGAGNAALVGPDRNRVREELAKLGALDRKRWSDSLVLNPIHLLQALSEAMEHATRLGEFLRGLEHEGTTAEGQARAALAARDVTIDFARGGKASKQINRWVAFFNATVQGNVRIAEVFRDDPGGATMRAMAALTLTALLLWAINRDDEEYHELPDWERNTYLHIPLGKGRGHRWARIPKPFTLGTVFMNVPEAALDWLVKNDADGLTRVLPDKDTAWHQLIAVMPTLFMPFVEMVTNYDTFRERAIVTPEDLDLDVALQYNRWTSDLAKFVGPKIGLAPAKLDHLIYGYGAGLARGAVEGVDAFAEALGLATRKPAGGSSNLPVVGTFIRDAPTTDAKSFEQFYRLRDSLTGAKESVTRYERMGDAGAARARADKLRTDFGPDVGQIDARVKAADARLKEDRREVNRVFASTALDPDEKKELLDRVYEDMLNAARAGLGKPALPSRFAKPIAPALLRKLRAPATAEPAR